MRGRVRVVEPYAFTKVSALGIEEQRVNVVVDLTWCRFTREGWYDGGGRFLGELVGSIGPLVPATAAGACPENVGR